MVTTFVIGEMRLSGHYGSGPSNPILWRRKLRLSKGKKPASGRAGSFQGPKPLSSPHHDLSPRPLPTSGQAAFQKVVQLPELYLAQVPCSVLRRPIAQGLNSRAPGSVGNPGPDSQAVLPAVHWGPLRSPLSSRVSPWHHQEVGQESHCPCPQLCPLSAPPDLGCDKTRSRVTLQEWNDPLDQELEAQLIYQHLLGMEAMLR